MIKNILYILFFFSVTSFNVKKNNSSQAISLIQKFIQKSESIKSVSFHLDYKERMEGELKHTIVKTKHVVHPFKLYAWQEKPTKGLEILYVKGKNNNKVLINPASFPWVNISLSPYSSTIRAEGHFTIFETGFAYFSNLAKYLIGPKKEDLTFEMVYTEVQSGKNLAKINIHTNEYKVINYKVKERESLRSISNKFNITEHSMIELNSSITGFNSKLNPGQIIKMPNAYAKRIEILMDVNLNLPYKIKVYDNVGLYQSYVFSYVKVNPQFTEQDFDEENKSYNF